MLFFFPLVSVLLLCHYVLLKYTLSCREHQKVYCGSSMWTSAVFLVRTSFVYFIRIQVRWNSITLVTFSSIFILFHFMCVCACACLLLYLPMYLKLLALQVRDSCCLVFSMKQTPVTFWISYFSGGEAGEENKLFNIIFVMIPIRKAANIINHTNTVCWQDLIAAFHVDT